MRIDLSEALQDHIQEAVDRARDRGFRFVKCDPTGVLCASDDDGVPLAEFLACAFATAGELDDAMRKRLGAPPQR